MLAGQCRRASRGPQPRPVSCSANLMAPINFKTHIPASSGLLGSVLGVESAAGTQTGTQVRVLRPDSLGDGGNGTERAQGRSAGDSGQQSPGGHFLPMTWRDGEKRAEETCGESGRPALPPSRCVTLSRSPSPFRFLPPPSDCQCVSAHWVTGPRTPGASRAAHCVFIWKRHSPFQP